MVEAQTPTIAKIKNEVSLNDARALLSIAICETCDFFNVSKNMNDAQVAMTADLIIERFWDFKLEEVKYCLRRAMRKERLYDRLDGNIILGWLEAYDAERTEIAMSISDKEAIKPIEAPDAMSYCEYKDMLEAKAATGDKDAAKRLSELEELQSFRRKSMNADNGREKEIKFKQFFYKYLKKKNENKNKE